jgi:hypothetical protein
MNKNKRRVELIQESIRKILQRAGTERRAKRGGRIASRGVYTSKAQKIVTSTVANIYGLKFLSVQVQRPIRREAGEVQKGKGRRVVGDGRVAEA